MMCPDCSPPSTALVRRISSSTYRSPTWVVDDLDVEVLHCLAEPKIGHDGGDDRSFLSLPCSLSAGEDRHQHVAVDGLTVLVDCNEAIGVAVEATDRPAR